MTKIKEAMPQLDMIDKEALGFSTEAKALCENTGLITQELTKLTGDDNIGNFVFYPPSILLYIISR